MEKEVKKIILRSGDPDLDLLTHSPKKKTTDEINYFSLLKTATLNAWRKKYLWFFGFFVGSVNFLNLNFHSFQFEPSHNQTTEKSAIFLSNEEVIKELIEKLNDYRQWVLIILAGFLLLGVFFFFLHIIAEIVLVKEGLKIEKNQAEFFIQQKKFSLLTFAHQIKTTIKAGLQYFWKTVFLNLIFFVFYLIFILCFLFFFFITKGSRIWESIFITPLSIFVLAGVLIISFFYIFALRILISKKEKTLKSIKLSIQFFKKFWAPCLITWMINLGFVIGAGISMIIGIVLSIIPLGVFAFILSLLFEKIGLIIGASLLGLAIFIIFLLTHALIGAVSYLYWTLIFKKLQAKNLEA